MKDKQAEAGARRSSHLFFFFFALLISSEWQIPADRLLTRHQCDGGREGRRFLFFPPGLMNVESPTIKRRRSLFLSLSLSAGHRVNDGLWHTVSVDTRNLQVSLNLDSEPPATIELWEQLEVKGAFNLGGGWRWNQLDSEVHSISYLFMFLTFQSSQ